ncbi:MAG: hypothetical protein R3E53_14310 [Myxococcota bacterium]
MAWIVKVSVSSTSSEEHPWSGQPASKLLGLKSRLSALTTGAPKSPFWSWTPSKVTVLPA